MCPIRRMGVGSGSTARSRLMFRPACVSSASGRHLRGEYPRSDRTATPSAYACARPWTSVESRVGNPATSRLNGRLEPVQDLAQLHREGRFKQGYRRTVAFQRPTSPWVRGRRAVIEHHPRERVFVVPWAVLEAIHLREPGAQRVRPRAGVCSLGILVLYSGAGNSGVICTRIRI